VSPAETTRNAVAATLPFVTRQKTRPSGESTAATYVTAPSEARLSDARIFREGGI
jgi:hypothetical protein